MAKTIDKSKKVFADKIRMIAKSIYDAADDIAGTTEGCIEIEVSFYVETETESSPELPSYTVTSKQMAKDFDNAVTMEIRRMYHVDVDTDELAKALKYDREQYEKGFADGKNDVIQRLLKTDGCELCPACIHSDNYLYSSPCSKCKHSYPFSGDDYYFVLKED